MRDDGAGSPTEPAAGPGLGPWAAAGLVFGSSAAVLVVELVALRLLAPYYGLTLETNTMVIGLALTAIAAGTWAGGWSADRVAPRHLLGPLLGISGAAVALTPTLVRGAAASGSPGMLLLMGTLSILVPGALLSAVTPVVIKLRLTSLQQTGSVVGHLSGIGTVGAIVGTVVTGFVLISRVPVSGILVGLGIALLVTSVAVQVAGRRGRGDVVLALVVSLAGLGAATSPSGCDVETTYHCLAVTADPDRETGRTLVLDNLRHSYVDLEDATYLEFAYVKAMASVTDTAFAADEPLDAYHLGAGGLTLPRYLSATRPGTTSEVSEIDAGVVAADLRLLGGSLPEGVEVDVEDGRLAIDELAPESLDLIVGDAFGGVSVPWHLATVEAVDGLEEALAEDGVYVANIIDFGPLDFARAAVATTADVFDHVALLADPSALAGETGGNLVVVASDAPLDTDAVVERMGERDLGWDALDGAGLAAWIEGAPVLRDDFAPVDQLLTPYSY
ncbi:MAG TPA: fused MFS/spermidine synthase [Nocardioides sp.]|nr:fused MFS/spermidine synthase [Nocardioides sp.]